MRNKNRVSYVIIMLILAFTMVGCGYQQIVNNPDIPEMPSTTMVTTLTSAVPTVSMSLISETTYPINPHSETEMHEEMETVINKKIGISMPSNTTIPWVDYGYYLKSLFEKDRYQVDLQFADQDILKQISQINDIILGNCDVLVISAIDGDSLTDVLALAKEKGIPVIALINFIVKSNAVTYFATYNYRNASMLQAEFIKTKLDIDKAKGSFNIEFFSGDPSDSNFNIFSGGAMDVLKPYLDKGILICPSGQTEYIQIATEGWRPEKAKERMESLIEICNYSPQETQLDAILCVSDPLSIGVISALDEVGYSKENFPIITGQNCEMQTLIYMLSGVQSMSVIRPARTLLDQTFAMVVALLNGEEVEVNDVESYDNETGIIPTYLCDPVVVTKENYREILIDNFYYSAEELDALE